MREFFKGWRRKSGCVTLGLACVLAVGMVRSLSKAEGVIFPIGNCLAAIVSIDCRFGLGIDTGQREISDPMWQTRDFIALDQFIDEDEPVWHLQYLGFHAVSGKDSTLIFAPYWSLVIPLNLLSAWLLLSKPRSATLTKTSEPVAAEGT